MSLVRDALLSPIEPAKSTSQVIHRISEAISSGVFKPGEQLPVETELAGQFNVAQMTLRQALLILRKNGFIETTRGRNGGSFVTTDPIKLNKIFQYRLPIIQDLDEFTAFQRAIENETAAIAAVNANQNAISNLKKSLDGCVLGGVAERDHWLADNGFHIAIAEATKSVRLIKAISQIQFETQEFFSLLDRPEHRAEHTAIFDAIAAGDSEKAFKASNEHCSNNHAFIVNLIDSSKD